MCNLRSFFFQGAFAVVLGLTVLPASAATDEPSPVQREIIPGSELMTAQERERYRQRQRGATSVEEREHLRAEHLKAMEERGRVHGLQVIDHSRIKKTSP
jgi:hypothetical protein